MYKSHFTDSDELHRRLNSLSGRTSYRKIACLDRKIASLEEAANSDLNFSNRREILQASGLEQWWQIKSHRKILWAIIHTLI